MFKFSLVLVVGIFSAFTTAQAEEFCGRIRGASYIETSRGLQAFAYLDQIRGMRSFATLSNQKIKLTDPSAVFKISKVISLLSIQDSTQLQEDLKAKNFDWYFLVGEEESTNPYEEDFSICLDADLDSITQSGELKSIKAIVDIFEDGHSVKDLL